MARRPVNILGVLSLIFWALTLVVTVKYLIFVMRATTTTARAASRCRAGRPPRESAIPADESGANRASPHDLNRLRSPDLLVILGLFGAALLYGDGVITPAISVLCAVEGLEGRRDRLSPFVVPITIVILVILFAVQKRGTGGIGVVFGPVMVLWFIVHRGRRAPLIVRHPEILRAMNPIYGARFFLMHSGHGFLVLGSVFLCVTGGEALYADMGHFGTRAIRLAWYCCVLPALLLNYFGQGALLLERPEAAANPFYGLVSAAWLYPMVVLATLATVIASQALISGAFSLTRQAVQLGYLPRVTIVHTSGQTGADLHPRGELAADGGLRGAGARLPRVERAGRRLRHRGDRHDGHHLGPVLFRGAHLWKWGAVRAGALLALFLLLRSLVLRRLLGEDRARGLVPDRGRDRGLHRHADLEERADVVCPNGSPPMRFRWASSWPTSRRRKPHRVPGVAVFLSSTRRGTPNVLLHHFKHNKVLHQVVVILSITTDAIPEVPDADKVRVKSFGQGFWGVTAHYGFKESPEALDVLRRCKAQGLPIDEADTSFYLGRETLRSVRGKGMAEWRKMLFRFLSRNARSASDFFALPPNRVVEIGAQIEL